MLVSAALFPMVCNDVVVWRCGREWPQTAAPARLCQGCESGRHQPGQTWPTTRPAGSSPFLALQSVVKVAILTIIEPNQFWHPWQLVWPLATGKLAAVLPSQAATR